MKVLLVVDMQKGFINFEYGYLVNKINKYIENNKYDKIIFTKFINENDSLFKSKLNYSKLQDIDSQKIVVNIPNNSVILEKTGYGLSLENMKYIKNLNIKQIDVCGLETDACVYAIALQLFDNNIYPNILINYVDTKEELKESIKNVLIRQFGSVDEKE